MDIFDDEIIKFRRSLQKDNVRFVMVGGFAANLHGYQRLLSGKDQKTERRK